MIAEISDKHPLLVKQRKYQSEDEDPEMEMDMMNVLKAKKRGGKGKLDEKMLDMKDTKLIY